MLPWSSYIKMTKAQTPSGALVPWLKMSGVKDVPFHWATSKTVVTMEQFTDLLKVCYHGNLIHRLSISLTGAYIPEARRNYFFFLIYFWRAIC